MRMLLSERMNPPAPPNVLITDEIPIKCRNQIRHLINDLFFSDELEYYADEDIVPNIICKKYDKLAGNPPMGHYNFQEFDRRLETYDCTDFFDLLDVTYYVFFHDEDFEEIYDYLESEVNEILKTNSVGYAVVNGEMIPITEHIIADEIIIPAFLILGKYGLEHISNELSDAFKHFKDGDNISAINSAHRAFEGTIDTLLKKNKIKNNNGDKTSNKIKALIKEQYIPQYTETFLNALASIINGPSNIRNNVSGHGSSSPKHADDALAKYEIDMVASTVLFLIETNYAQNG